MSERRKAERRSGDDRRVRTIENFDEAVATYLARDPMAVFNLSGRQWYRQGEERRGRPRTPPDSPPPSQPGDAET